MEITLNAIGYIKSDIINRKDLPRQSVFNQDKTAILELLPEYADDMLGIKANTHIVILFNFHQSDKSPDLITRRYGEEELTGVFNTRSPHRPNGIGLSIVKVTKVYDNKLEFQGVDMLDGTPVLDIKPYIEQLNPA